MGAYEDGYNDGVGYNADWLELYLEKLGFGSYDIAYYIGRYHSGTSMRIIYDEIDTKLKNSMTSNDKLKSDE